MKITVITGGSDNSDASTILAERFITGAEEAGCEVFRFDTVIERVPRCLGCGRCGLGRTKCVHKDFIDELTPELLTSNAVALVTPVDGHGIPAKFKMAVDRFYINNFRVKGGGRKMVLIAASNEGGEAAQELNDYYNAVVKRLEWQDAGILMATGCGGIEGTDYPAQAYRMGNEIGE